MRQHIYFFLLDIFQIYIYILTPHNTSFLWRTTISSFLPLLERISRPLRLVYRSENYIQRKLFGILLNQTEIRLYLPCTDWFGTANGQCPFAVPNQSENGKYNLVSVWFKEIPKRFLCVYLPLQSYYVYNTIYFISQLVIRVYHNSISNN